MIVEPMSAIVIMLKIPIVVFILGITVIMILIRRKRIGKLKIR